MGNLNDLYLHSMTHPDVAEAFIEGKNVPEALLVNDVPNTSVAGNYTPTPGPGPEPQPTDPDWVETGRELTSTECVKEDGENTGMAIKTYAVTYEDQNEQSATYGETKVETETETVEDTESCPVPQPEPEPVEADWDYIHDEQSWNAAYQEDRPLYKYYQNNPEEDLWNTAENRAVNFNDRRYAGNVDGESVECSAKWESDTVQSVVIDGVTYYGEIFYDTNSHSLELFNDVNLTETTGKTFEISTVSFSEDCVHCWKGSINAPGAKYPWAAVAVPEPFAGTIQFIYDGGTPVYPWGEYKEFTKGYGIASIPTELGDEYLLDENGNTTFDNTKLQVLLIAGTGELPATEG
jgi:hypothetical protein